MGFIDTLGTFGVGDDDVDFFPVFYNVVHAIGENSPNQRDDVLLIQQLLYLTYKPFPQSAPKGRLTIDGVCGGITKNWILKFQLDMRALGNSIQADKRVDRIRDKEGMVGSLSDTYYTLAYLNWYTSYYTPEEYAKIPLHIPLQNIATVPPPSNDVVNIPEPRPLYAVGGI